MESRSTPTPLFAVSNHHTPQSGTPCLVTGDDERAYHGYFENRHGEQAVFVFDHETGKARVALGDAGWELWHPVVGGKAEGVILSPEENVWLEACWLAVASRGTGAKGTSTSR